MKKNIKTAERPQEFVADAQARYFFAKIYCRGKSVLDVGCGLGYGARYLRDNGAKNVLGIDYSKESIEIAQSLKRGGLDFKVHDALRLGTFKRKFDVVCAFEILEHLPVQGAQSFIDSIYDILNRNGILLLSTPNGLKTELFFGRPYNAYHVKEYGGYEVSRLLDKKFNQVDIKGYTCVNTGYLKSQKSLTNSLSSQVFHFVGGFKWFREFLAFVPSSFKKKVTGEEALPKLTSSDYKKVDDWVSCEGIFASAKKVSREVRAKPFLSIIIPNYNGDKYLESCIASVLKIDYPAFEVIVCDDASADKSVSIVQKFQKLDKRVRILRNPTNLGAAASKNKGVLAAKGEIVLFLDSDTEVKKNFASFLVSELVGDDDLVAAQSVIMDYDDRSLIQQAGGVINPTTGYLKAFLQWQNFIEKLRNGELQGRNIAGVSGSLAVKRHFFEKVKGFDELEARHSEDVDFSWRAWALGGKMKLVPKSLIYHKNKPMSERALMNATKEYIHFHLVRNSIRSMLKNYELSNLLKYLPIAICLNLGRVVVALFDNNRAIVLGTLKGMVWNALNIRDTISSRLYVQKYREKSDAFLFSNIFDKAGALLLYRNYLAINKK